MSDETKKYPAWKNAVDVAVSQFTFGDVIPKAWFLREFEISMPASGKREVFEELQWRFLESMEGFKKQMLVEHNMALDNARGKGYMIVQPHEQHVMAMRDLKREVTRSMHKAAERLTYVEMSRLTDEQARRHTDAQGKVAALAALNRKQIRDMKP